MKFIVPPLRLISVPVTPVMEPTEPAVKVPLQPVRLMPVAAEVVDASAMATFSAPLVLMLMMPPVPLQMVLAMVRFPTAPPSMSKLLVFATAMPVMVLLVARVMPAPPLFVMTGLSFTTANVTPLSTRAVPSPQSVWSASRVMPPA